MNAAAAVLSCSVLSGSVMSCPVSLHTLIMSSSRGALLGAVTGGPGGTTLLLASYHIWPTACRPRSPLQGSRLIGCSIWECQMAGVGRGSSSGLVEGAFPRAGAVGWATRSGATHSYSAPYFGTTAHQVQQFFLGAERSICPELPRKPLRCLKMRVLIQACCMTHSVHSLAVHLHA